MSVSLFWGEVLSNHFEVLSEKLMNINPALYLCLFVWVVGYALRHTAKNKFIQIVCPSFLGSLIKLINFLMKQRLFIPI